MKQLVNKKGVLLGILALSLSATSVAQAREIGGMFSNLYNQIFSYIPYAAGIGMGTGALLMMVGINEVGKWVFKGSAVGTVFGFVIPALISLMKTVTGN